MNALVLFRKIQARLRPYFKDPPRWAKKLLITGCVALPFLVLLPSFWRSPEPASGPQVRIGSLPVLPRESVAGYRFKKAPIRPPKTSDRILFGNGAGDRYADGTGDSPPPTGGNGWSNFDWTSLFGKKPGWRPTALGWDAPTPGSVDQTPPTGVGGPSGFDQMMQSILAAAQAAVAKAEHLAGKNPAPTTAPMDATPGRNLASNSRSTTIDSSGRFHALAMNRGFEGFGGPGGAARSFGGPRAADTTSAAPNTIASDQPTTESAAHAAAPTREPHKTVADQTIKTTLQASNYSVQLVGYLNGNGNGNGSGNTSNQPPATPPTDTVNTTPNNTTTPTTPFDPCAADPNSAGCPSSGAGGSNPSQNGGGGGGTPPSGSYPCDSPETGSGAYYWYSDDAFGAGSKCNLVDQCPDGTAPAAKGPNGPSCIPVVVTNGSTIDPSSCKTLFVPNCLTNSATFPYANIASCRTATPFDDVISGVPNPCYCISCGCGKNGLTCK